MVAARLARRLVFLAVAVPALACAVGGRSAAAAASEPPAAVAEGEAALAAFDLQRAVAAFRAARAAAPQSYAAAWELSRALTYQALLATDRDEDERLSAEAAALARDAIRIDPGAAPGHLYLAVAAGRLAERAGGARRIRLAREIWSEATRTLRIDPESDLAHHVLGVWNRKVVEVGRLQVFLGSVLYGPLPPASLEDAIDHLRRAVELRPASVAHRVELGIALDAAGRPAAAREQLAAALALPDSVIIDGHYRSLGRRALERIGRRLERGPSP